MLFGDFNTSILFKKNSHNLRVGSRGVHGSGRVGFVPDPDSTQNFRVGENETETNPEC